MAWVNRLISYLFAMGPTDKAHNVDIWNYYKNDCYLNWDSTKHIYYTSHQQHGAGLPFTMRYYGYESESPLSSNSSFTLWNRDGYALGKCRYNLEAVDPHVDMGCTYHWTFHRRKQGGLYIKPSDDLSMCIHANNGRVYLETCRHDRKGMAFLYGTEAMRKRFDLLVDLLRRFRGNKRKSAVLKRLIQSGDFLYAPQPRCAHECKPQDPLQDAFVWLDHGSIDAVHMMRAQDYTGTALPASHHRDANNYYDIVHSRYYSRRAASQNPFYTIDSSRGHDRARHTLSDRFAYIKHRISSAGHSRSRIVYRRQKQPNTEDRDSDGDTYGDRYSDKYEYSSV